MCSSAEICDAFRQNYENFLSLSLLPFLDTGFHFVLFSDILIYGSEVTGIFWSSSASSTASSTNPLASNAAGGGVAGSSGPSNSSLHVGGSLAVGGGGGSVGNGTSYKQYKLHR